MTELFYEKIKKPILTQGILEVVLKFMLFVFSIIFLFVPTFVITVDGVSDIPITSFDYVKACISGERCIEELNNIAIVEVLMGFCLMLMILYFLYSLIISIFSLMDLKLYAKYVFFAIYSDPRYAARTIRLSGEASCFLLLFVIKLFPGILSMIFALFSNELTATVSFNTIGVFLQLFSTVACLVLTSYIKPRYKKLPRYSDSYLNQNDN